MSTPLPRGRPAPARGSASYRSPRRVRSPERRERAAHAAGAIYSGRALRSRADSASRDSSSRRAQTAPQRRRSLGGFSVLFALLGGAVYFGSVLFVVGDQGLTTDTDAVAGQVALGCAGLLCTVGFFLSLAGLGQPGRRGSAALGFLVNAAFLAFVGFILWRGG